MRGSWAVDAQEALITLLRARPALAGLQIEYAWPGDEAQRECIWGGGDVEWTSDQANLREGRKTLDEEFTLDLAIDVFLEGGTQAAADRRTLALYAELEAAVADDHRLGIADRNFLWARCSRGRLTRLYNSTGRGARLVAGVTCKARLR